MRNPSIATALLVVLSAAPAAASEQADVMAAVNQFNDGINKGDTKTAFAACASPAFIIDEFPPHVWQGATACADWAAAYEADMKKKGITEPFVTLGKPRHVDVTGDRAYVVAPASYKFKKQGKAISETGATLTLALQKTQAGWAITSWAWSKP